MDIDFLIVGQGLAGSLIAWELIQRQKKVIIVDNGKENASLIAAGLINPITGMRFVKSTNIEQLLPTALAYYQQLSDFFQQTFYIEKDMLRIIRNKTELVTCQQRIKLQEYQNYLSEIIPPSSYAPYGIVKQKHSGYLLTHPLLVALKKYFIALNAYIKTEFDYNEIILSPRLQWSEFHPKKIIFCEGHHASNNPWFSWLPFQPVKGEIITATATEETPQHIINYGHWLIPLSAQQFRTGATFDRQNLNTHTTIKAKQTLCNTLKQFYPQIKLDHIIKQQAGIRPTTLDKYPFIGNHPKLPELVIFNGFGAKGSLQIPWYSLCLVNNLLNNNPIPSSSQILRYYENYIQQTKNT